MSKKQIVTMDGNEAAAYVAYAFTEVAAIYPITPSSTMAEKTDVWSASGRKNVFGMPVDLIEMQSEAGAIGAIHGSLETGALSTTFTSSQGLMLMIPVLHRIAGERHPGVLHVAARTVGTHAMSIFGDHSDVMNCRQTGLAMLSSGSVQEVMDLAGIAHLAAIEGRVPFMHFFDGFRTSHEISKIEAIDYKDFKKMINMEALEEFRNHALNPEHPMLRATVQNPDVYFQVREANNRFYDAIPGIVEKYMGMINKLTGRDYRLFNYYGAPDADRVIIAMGSVCSTICQAVDHLNKNGQKVGLVQVHLFRPFSCEHLLSAIPDSVKRISVLDRCKEMGSAGEPLFQDVCTAFTNAGRNVHIIGGRYGLSSKDTDPAQIKAVYDNMLLDEPKANFTIGINDDVTHLSLPVGEPLYPDSYNTLNCKFWGLGSDGTVGANKNTVQIISNHTDKYAQAYFEYDAKKSFGVTKSHLRFAPNPIRSTYYVKKADFIGVHNQTYIKKYDIVSELKENGSLLLNCKWKPEELEEQLPADVKRQLAEKNASLYIIDAEKISEDIGMPGRFNLVLQSAFFKISGLLPIDEAVEYMKKAAKKTYSNKGHKVVDMNLAAIDAGVDSLIKVEIPASWANAREEKKVVEDKRPAVVAKLLEPINAQKGDDLPVSAFEGYEDGAIDMGLTAYEKRAIAVHVPKWDSTKCLQCNMCSYVCPHAVIRPYLMNEDEVKNAPASFESVPAKGKAAEGYNYTLQVSALDCTGCGSCVTSCLAKDKAITMVPIADAHIEGNWDYALSLSDKPAVFDKYSIKGSQFMQPLVEFSAACAGCGETPYAKLMTQLFGDRVYWANATGCSQAWGAPMPGIPYTTNKEGRGPAWTNSLFENNAEFSLGMFLSVRHQRESEKLLAQSLIELTDNAEVKAALSAWIEAFDDFDESDKAGKKLVKILNDNIKSFNGESKKKVQAILSRKDQLAKKTFWMYGGDGWAYDIGYGGLDHVVATGEDINIFVIDTEVYSNTGGQSSKSTPIGAVAQFCSSGKKSYKKDLGSLMMAYGNVYVAQVAMGANPNQLIKALKEAQEYPGPSVVVAYTPCISHGIKKGMAYVQEEMKDAVEAGYWHLYRYNPLNEKPFTLDSAKPSVPFEDFLKGEVRYASLYKTFPENAEKYFELGKKAADKKYNKYSDMAD